MSGELKHIEVYRITPRHAAIDPDLVEQLKEDMRQNGWRGRPLLVVNRNQSHELHDYEGLTGAHRSTAATELGIPIPVLVLEQRDLPNGFSLTEDHREYERIFRDKGLHEAADLMHDEAKLGGNAKRVSPK
ncbi:MAG: ParB N-terminal domain-containing protein [Terracidiphilus sp.]|jgi:hypothetical protein